MEIQIVEFFKSWSCKFCDLLFSFTNLLGEDLFFYLILFILIWAYRKEYALKYAVVYLTSCVFNIGLKKVVRRPRPLGATAGGYSFPSGHSQSFSSVGTGLLYEANKNQYPKKKWMRIELLFEFIIFGALVGIGRMYFSQHYLTDVLAGLILGVVITVAATYILDVVIDRLKGSKLTLDKILLIFVPVVFVGYILIISLDIFTDIDDLFKVYRIIGIYLSIVVGYFIDKKWIKYNPDDTLKNKLIKVITGSATIMVMYMMVVYKAELDVVRGADPHEVMPIYYFVLGLIATVVLPWIFKTIKNEPQQSIENKGKK